MCSFALAHLNIENSRIWDFSYNPQLIEFNALFGLPYTA